MSIEDCEFSDEEIFDVRVENKTVELISTTYGAGCVSLNKDDAIALAKHFKLTEEDLK